MQKNCLFGILQKRVIVRKENLKFLLVFRNGYYLFGKERIIKIICFHIEKQKTGRKIDTKMSKFKHS